MECGNYILISYKNGCWAPIQASAVLDTGIQRNKRQTQLRENFYWVKDKHVSIRRYQTGFMTGRYLTVGTKGKTAMCCLESKQEVTCVLSLIIDAHWQIK